MISAALVTVALFAPAQDAPAPAPVVSGRRYVLAEPVPVKFSIPTSAGPVEGTILATRVDTRGAEGWGRFELRISLDPDSVNTGDPVIDRHIARTVLKADAGNVSLGSVTRLSPRARAGQGETPEDEMYGARCWLDPTRGGSSVELRYGFEAEADTARLQIAHTATLEELGLGEVKHPFVQVTGPLSLQIDAPLVRSR